MSLAGGWDASPVTPQPPGPPYLKTHLDAVYKNNIFLVIFLDVLPPTKEKNKINAYVHINTKKKTDIIWTKYLSNNQGTCNIILPLTPVLIDSEVSSESRKTSPPLPLWSLAGKSQPRPSS